MIRTLLFFAFLLVVYYVIKSLFVSAARTYHEEERGAAPPRGEEMVQDPECRVYVPKGRAVHRRIRGDVAYFCSEACAKKYEEKKGH